MPFVWVVVMLVTWGLKANEPITGWRKALIRPFLKFWAHVLLHIGFNYWPSVKGTPHPTETPLNARTGIALAPPRPETPVSLQGGYDLAWARVCWRCSIQSSIYYLLHAFQSADQVLHTVCRGGSVFSIGYVRLLAHGPAGYENIVKAEECHAMLIFNHVSYVDGIILGAIYLPCGLAKASIADIPFFGRFTKVSAPSMT